MSVCPKCGASVSLYDTAGNPWYACGSTNKFRSASCVDREPVATQLRAAQDRIKRLEDRIKQMENCIENAWSIIANVSGGDWSKQHLEWRQTTLDWRNNSFHPIWAEVATLRAEKAKEDKL